MEQNEVRIYVGRWDLLPAEWEGINGLYEATKDDILTELGREIEEWAKLNPYEDNLMGVYTLIEFEEEFNGDNERKLNGTDYWIKIF